MPMMDDFYREISGDWMPQPPQQPELWSGSVWVIGSLGVALAAALADWLRVPAWIIAALTGLLLVTALVHYFKAKTWHRQAYHLYELKLMSRLTGKAPLMASAPPEPDFHALDSHFPEAEAVHHTSWDLRIRNGHDLVVPTEEDKARIMSERHFLNDVQAVQVLPRTCYRCRRWLWSYRLLARLP